MVVLYIFLCFNIGERQVWEVELEHGWWVSKVSLGQGGGQVGFTFTSLVPASLLEWFHETVYLFRLKGL